MCLLNKAKDEEVAESDVGEDRRVGTLFSWLFFPNIAMYRHPWGALKIYIDPLNQNLWRGSLRICIFIVHFS